MQEPKLVSIGYAVPPLCLSQRQVFDSLGYPPHFWRLFDPKTSGVETRHFAVSLIEAQHSSWQQMCEAYIEHAKVLTLQSIHNCLDGRNASQIGCATYVSCSGGFTSPSILHFLASEVGLRRNCFITHLTAHGCEGGFPGLKRAYDFTMATGLPSLATATEICSSACFPEPNGPDPENDFELARGNVIFADASVALLIGYDDNPAHPYILDFETIASSQHIDLLGFVWRDGRLRLRMSRAIKQVVPGLASEVVHTLLGRWNLTTEQVAHWIIHTAGQDILKAVGEKLHLSEEKLALSLETLRRFGNTSATSIGISGKRLMEKKQWQPGDYIMVVALGPGMSAGCTLLRFSP